MKDSVITAKRKKIELITLLICFVASNLLNIYAIINYNTSFKELFTELGYVAVLTIGLYVGWGILRLIFYLIRKIF